MTIIQLLLPMLVLMGTIISIIVAGVAGYGHHKAGGSIGSTIWLFVWRMIVGIIIAFIVSPMIQFGIRYLMLQVS